MSIQEEPHYELPSTELAKWIEHQGLDRWWNVDGDSLLPIRLSLPCPADELVAELRFLNRPLLVADKDKNPGAEGQRVSAKDLDQLVDHWSRLEGPNSVYDRHFYLCWKNKPKEEWLLLEDLQAMEDAARDALEQQELS
jgi:hypothetical protein